MACDHLPKVGQGGQHFGEDSHHPHPHYPFEHFGEIDPHPHFRPHHLRTNSVTGVLQFVPFHDHDHDDHHYHHDHHDHHQTEELAAKLDKDLPGGSPVITSWPKYGQRCDDQT